MIIKAKVITDSVSPAGIRLTTLELEFPRFILAEISKHRVFSMSAQSTRAVPVNKFITMVNETPFIPAEFGRNQSGMQSTEPLSLAEQEIARNIWIESSQSARVCAEKLRDLQVHKQFCGRILEPYLWQKTVITATEFDNFFSLRLHKDAQPELRVLAEKMKAAMNASTPKKLWPEEWHLPYVKQNDAGGLYTDDDCVMTLEDALKYSAAKCASQSYRTESLSLERGLAIYQKLVESEPFHSVPCEHQATPMEPLLPTDFTRCKWMDTPGITHMDRECNLWSANFKGWLQQRKILGI